MSATMGVRETLNAYVHLFFWELPATKIRVFRHAKPGEVAPHLDRGGSRARRDMVLPKYALDRERHAQIQDALRARRGSVGTSADPPLEATDASRGAMG